MLSSDLDRAWHALIFATATRALRSESCCHYDRLRLPVSVCYTPNRRKRKSKRNGRRRRRRTEEEMEQEEAEEEEGEGEVEMTKTTWGLQQQPGHVVSIEEAKLKK